MKNLKDIAIGKKLGLILGGCVFLLAGLSLLSLWGFRSMERYAATGHDRLTKELLADQIARGVGSINIHMQVIVSKQSGIEQEKAQLLKVRKAYLSAIDGFKALADSEQSRQHARDFDELAREFVETDDRIMQLVAANRRSEALEIYREKSLSIFRRFDAKANEAEQWQEERVADNEREQKAFTSQCWLIIVAGSVAAIALALLGWAFLTRGIARPLRMAVAHLNEVAGGDLSKDAPADFQNRGDEIGLLARAKQSMIVNLRQMVKEVGAGVQVLSSSSSELSVHSNVMSDGSREASEKAHAVAAAAEQMTANVGSVAAGMEQTTTNLSSVSLHTEQMTATIGEIAANSEKARRITDEATRQAARINEQMNQLGNAAREIGKVTETITEISSQTNLLALNATIEAARAGSAGKGFAVVANEIKELAQQTASATEDIKARIEGVQSSTSGGIAEIEKVSKVIHEVSEIVSSIAAAIEEQATATKDIARNIAEASEGVKDANQRVAESSAATQDIARQITAVDRAAGQIANGSGQVQSRAADLSHVSDNLQTVLARFHV